MTEGQFEPVDLAAQLAEAERRASWALTRVSEVQAELHRANEWRRITVAAVVAVALLAILMLGIVAFKAIDAKDAAGDSETGAGRAAGAQLTARALPVQ